MPIEAPNLDTRTFEDLLREARLRIPRYCQEWTDFNDSDPGMAVVQLFAWFTEMMLYGLNQVPEKNYRKFLELLNLQPRPAQPARAYVYLAPTDGGKPIALKIRSLFEVAGADGTLSFETTDALDLIPYPLDAVQVWDGSAYTDVSAVNERGTESFRPFGWSPQVGNALYLGFNFKPQPPTLATIAPTFPDKLVLRVFVPPPLSGTAPQPSRGGPQPIALQTLVWEYRSKLDLAPGQSADTLDRWRPLTVLKDEAIALTREGTIELRGPGSDLLPSKVGLPTADDGQRYWLRCRFARGTFPADRVPEVAFLRPNVVEVENLRTFQDEALGESDGFRRSFTLRHPPVVPQTLQLVIDPDSDDQPWKLVEDFLASGPDDKDYTVNAGTGEVLFGDGATGRVPPPGGVVIARQYLSGGGLAGNVAAGAIAAPPVGVSGIATVTNPRPAIGGEDEETLDALKARAPQALRGDGRAVTAEDYQRFAEGIPGVAKATVLQMRNPNYPGFDIPGTVTVVIVPDAVPAVTGVSPTGPIPTQALLDLVANQLNSLRTVGTELWVTGPRYKQIVVRTTVVTAQGATDAQARAGVEKAIEDFLAPIPRPVPKPPVAVPAPGGAAAPRPAARPPRYPNGWPFGEPFYPAQLYEAILSATDDGGNVLLVRNVTNLQILVDGQDQPIGLPVHFDQWPDTLPVGVAEVEIDLTNGGGA